MRKLLIVFSLLAAAVTIAPIAAAYAAPKREHPDVVAVALGTLNESEGDQAVVDFRAGKTGDDAKGNLRFYSEEHGYYNGAVKRLSIENGVIKAAGGGGLVKPDGTRFPVRFEAEFHASSKRVSIKVQGREGYQYTLDGVLDPGFIKIGNPEQTERKNKQ